MQQHFEVTLKGRLGHDPEDKKEMRVLNMLLRVTAKGILYEPDPRHIELLAKSLDIDPNKKPSVTPGQNINYADRPEDIVASLHSVTRATAKVSFNPGVQVFPLSRVLRFMASIRHRCSLQVLPR